jgi:hypothetical protein
VYSGARVHYNGSDNPDLSKNANGDRKLFDVACKVRSDPNTFLSSRVIQLVDSEGVMINRVDWEPTAAPFECHFILGP